MYYTPSTLKCILKCHTQHTGYFGSYCQMNDRKLQSRLLSTPNRFFTITLRIAAKFLFICLNHVRTHICACIVAISLYIPHHIIPYYKQALSVAHMHSYSAQTVHRYIYRVYNTCTYEGIHTHIHNTLLTITHEQVPYTSHG